MSARGRNPLVCPGEALDALAEFSRAEPAAFGLRLLACDAGDDMPRPGEDGACLVYGPAPAFVDDTPLSGGVIEADLVQVPIDKFLRDPVLGEDRSEKSCAASSAVFLNAKTFSAGSLMPPPAADNRC
jgi:hypothetical protein